MEDLLLLKTSICETGRMLLEQKLVARTWGNISARVDEKSCVISPSGLDYLHTEPEDVALLKLDDMSYEGRRKPSSEKGIHAAAYRVFPDVNYVIHTHQDFATALGLGGFDETKLTAEEKEILGTVAVASYGLPGTKKLMKNVKAAYEGGARVVLMEHHGVVVCGTSREDAMKMVHTLEEVCKKQIWGFNPTSDISPAEQFARLGIALPAQLDDMAQMIGKKIPVCENNEIEIAKALEKSAAVVVKNVGIRVKGEDEEDEAALQILSNKAALTYLHTKALGKKAKLSAFDARLMRSVYVKKYSKQKKG